GTILGFLLIMGCHSKEAAPVAATPASLPSTAYLNVVPPAIPQRQIGPPPATMPAGRLINIEDNGVKFLLFIPSSYRHRGTTHATTNLTIHFHGASWFVIQEHLRRGLKGPLLCAELGEGSSVYRKPFEDRQRLKRLISRVELEVLASVHQIDISSF